MRLIGRRELIAGLSAAAWPVVARAQQPAMPVIGLVGASSPVEGVRNAAAFRAGLAEPGYVDGRNVAVEYHWLEGQFDRLPALMADLVRRRVAVIATAANNPAAIAAKAVTTTIPIVFGVGEDPVALGLVASLARPGGNATGFNFLNNEAVSKRLGLLHELAPTATRIAVLINPASIATSGQLRVVEDAARRIGLSIDLLKAATIGEIEDAFAIMARERTTALFIIGDAFFGSRRVQLATLAARHGIASCFSTRAYPEVGGLMSYGTDILDVYRHVGAYTGQIIRGAKPADLPVVQATKFSFVINMQTAKALGIEVPPTLLAQADEVIE